MQEDEESFYSVYSNESMFQNINTVVQQQPSLQTSKPKVAQSNLALDMRFDQSQNRTNQYIKYQSSGTIIEQNQFAEISSHNISQIDYKEDLNRLDISLSLIRQIGFLSIDRVSPQELKEIHNKIQTLKREQFHLSSSLLMANQLLTNAQARNKILQEQMQNMKMQKKSPSFIKPYGNVNIGQNRIATIISEHRKFVQQISLPNRNERFGQLKLMYKECCFMNSFCLQQTEQYKIEVKYQKNHGQLILEINLVPYPHIINRGTIRFGLEILQIGKQHQIEKMSQNGVNLIERWTAWKEGMFQLQLVINRLDITTKQLQKYKTIVPLPLNHFLEPRLIFAAPQFTQKLKKSLSSYSLTFTGLNKEMQDLINRIRGMWWVDRFVNTIGTNQLIYIKIGSLQKQLQLNVQVWGKKDGMLITGSLEFLSFLLSP